MPAIGRSSGRPIPRDKRVIREDFEVRGGAQDHREIVVGVMRELVGARKTRTLHEKREVYDTYKFNLTPKAAHSSGPTVDST